MDRLQECFNHYIFSPSIVVQGHSVEAVSKEKQSVYCMVSDIQDAHLTDRDGCLHMSSGS